MKKWFFGLLLLIGVMGFSSVSSAQSYFLYQTCNVVTPLGQAVAGAQVYFLNQPANTTLLTPLATVFSNGLGTGGPVTQPIFTNGLGNCSGYLTPGVYTVCYIAAQIGQTCLPDQVISGPGGGSGVTQGTGPVTFGPGSGSVATTITPVVSPGTCGDANHVSQITYNAAGQITGCSPIDTDAITQIAGGGTDATTPSGGGVVPITLNTVNSSPGTFGSSSQVPVTTVNGKGLVTAITLQPINYGEGLQQLVTASGQFAVAYPSSFTLIQGGLGPACGSAKPTGSAVASNQSVIAVATACGSGLSANQWGANFSGFTLPAGITAGQVTQIDAFTISGFGPVVAGTVFNTMNCTSSDSSTVTFTVAGSITQYSGTMMGLTGSELSTVNCTASVNYSDYGGAGVDVTLNTAAIGLIIYYTGSPIPSNNIVNVASPLYYNSSTNLLSVDTSFPFPTNDFEPVTVATLGIPLQYINQLRLVSDGASSTDCTTGSGTNIVLCLSSGSSWSAFGTGGVTGVASFNSRTGAVTPTSGDYSVGQVTGAAPLASPAFSGTPTAPTQSCASNTDIATGAYVAACAGGTGSSVSVNSGSTIASPNLNSTTPAAPSNGIAVTFAQGSGGTIDDVSAAVVGDGDSSHFLNGVGAFTSPSTGGPAVFPCDILATAGTPCIAAHSVTRKMLASYTGALFELQRTSDSTFLEVYALPSGLVNTNTIANFCANTTCDFSIIYDQMNTPSSGNNLPATGAAQAPLSWASFANGQLPIVSTVSGQYYRNRASTVNMPTGSQPITEYMVINNSKSSTCCGTYGDMESSVVDNGPGHMFALAYSTGTSGSFGTGPGPWPGVDWENGVYLYGATPTESYLNIVGKYNTTGPAWELRSGDATTGSLTTLYNGALPGGYSAAWEGGLSLGEGGDASAAPVAFLEGAIIASTTTDATDNSVQSNVTAFYSNPGFVYSFNGRIGQVISQTGDYTAAQVTNAADKSTANTFSGGLQKIATASSSTVGQEIQGSFAGAPTIVHIQGATSNSSSTAFGSNVTAGSTLIAICVCSNSPSFPTTFSDTLSNTWTLLGSDTTDQTVVVYVALNSPPGADTVTTNANFTKSVIIEEYSGLATSSIVDVSTTYYNAGGPGSVTIGPVTTTVPDLIFSVLASNANCFSAITVSSPLTPRNYISASSGCVLDADIQENTPGAYSSVWTNGTTAGPMWGLLVGLKVGTGGSPQTANLSQWKYPDGTILAGVGPVGLPFLTPLTFAGVTGYITCASGTEGTSSFITDSTIASSLPGTAVSGGGSNHTPIICEYNGTGYVWVVQ